MRATAIVFEKPEVLSLRSLDLVDPTDDDIVVESIWSGVSSGTEKLLFTGRMPQFPGLKYPLVPGYETVGRVTEASSASGFDVDDLVFVPGANCYREAAGLFGASASHLVVSSQRAVKIPEAMADTGMLLSLAATAYHAVTLPDAPIPQVIVGHGIVGRLIARIIIALGHEAPQVWETQPVRQQGAAGYEVVAGPDGSGQTYSCILDASGDTSILDIAVPHLSPRGQIILAGFYGERMSFPFVPAFMREASIRIAAEFKPDDIRAVLDLVTAGRLSLDNLMTNFVPAEEACAGYPVAFTDPACVKMAIDWRTLQ